MKKIKTADLRNKTREELKNMLSTLGLELTQEKMAVMTQKQKNIKSLKNKRNEIARLNTVIREKELENKHD